MNDYEKEQERLEAYKQSQEFQTKYAELKTQITKNGSLHIPHDDDSLADYYNDLVNSIRRTSQLKWQVNAEPSDIYILSDDNLMMTFHQLTQDVDFAPLSEMFEGELFFNRLLTCGCSIEGSFSDETTLTKILAWISCEEHSTNIPSLTDLLNENGITT